LLEKQGVEEHETEGCYFIVNAVFAPQFGGTTVL
jgi:hypothetical protein